MRLCPRRLRRSLLAAAVLAGGGALGHGLGIGPAPAVAAPDPEAQTQQKLEEVRQQLEQSRQEQQTLSKTADALTQEVEDLRSRLVAAAAKVQDYEESLSYLETRMAELREEEEALHNGLEARNAQMAQVLTALQRLSWRPKETLLMQPGSPEDTVRSALLMRSAVPAIGAEAKSLRADIDRLTDLRDAIAGQHDQIAALGKDLEGEHNRLQDLVARKAALVEQTSRRSQEAARRAQTLAADAETMRDLLDKLAEDRRKREEEEKRQRELAEARRIAAHVAAKPAPPAPAAPPPPAGATGPGGLAPAAGPLMAPDGTTALLPVSPPAGGSRPASPATAPASPATTQTASVSANGGAMPPPPKAAATQAALRPLDEVRGAMPLPARGRVATRYGSELSPGNTSKGIVIETRGGAAVVAPADGVVAFSGPFRGYGHLLILEHAGGYHTLLSGMSRIDAQVGQRLLAGEPVGVMERSDGPSLYVELRRDGQPIDPLPWLAANKGKISG
ncbi:murein hydrolase activator EnvC family protein [Caenispirillum bisanense]|uniref:murein hydrolase activator EnvC family protein n=1 Tax=Caenispirillum bisanense TaxID=414052 RepID=UPI0031DC56AB